MDFSLSDEHRMLQDSLRGILNRHSGDDALAPLLEAGVIEALLTEGEGGFDGSGAAVALVFEELGRAGAALPLIGTMIGRAALAQAGMPEDAARAAFADAEPGTRADRGVAIRADADRLTGRKTMVAGAEDATHLIVTTADGLWLVAARAEGLAVTAFPMMDGQRGADLEFAETPAHRLGSLTDFGAVLSRAALAHAARTLGEIEAAVDLTLDYLRTRKQFGRALFDFQALAHRAAELTVEREQARSAVVNLAAHLDAEPHLRDRHVQACKVTVGRVARLVAEEAVQLHGGIGMTEEYALSGMIRRLIAGDTAMGDADYHLERFANGEGAWA
ncbi:acyl-CoA dehydrogenase [Paracoccus sp. 1_MG-2023]|uniref:acyl-CoA dehydrogenase family protein n=1 Tax=unclassified Paracoccus (in: a-proteobacteria) TaxID=2688777 RepID=UPI001C0A020C|nr:MULTISPECIES: acyl-CoA dehydrogenase [unclassified Paracoccus (in: a-proteobacteria)]MBU2956906.1 acyl-CoA dehydrogenase [Paracoccus sp. C2R09]MDO6668104.1 acyl-CoA dehydrogenase [Paracoccus sp. 1_MG-2023]